MGLFNLTRETFFFTEVDKLKVQLENEAFGRNITSTEYPVTSKHRAHSTPKAFAITGGVLFAVEQDSDHLNLILRPSVYTTKHLPSVSCFVYKGIKKSSLLKDNGTCIGDQSLNEVTYKIHENDRLNFDAANEDSDAVYEPNTPASLIVPYKSLPDDTKVFEIFRNIDINQPILITEGDHLGDFDETGFGFEIILEGWEHELTLGTLRTKDNIITAPELPWLPSELQTFENAVAKEKILNFLDPTVFFSYFYNTPHDRGLRYFNGGDLDTAYRAELYDTILSKFYNKNTQYLDIRNSLNYSMNFFGNLPTDKVYLGLGTAVSRRLGGYNYKRNGWPLLTIEGSEFSDFRQLRIQLPLDDDMPIPEFYFLGDENSLPKAEDVITYGPDTGVEMSEINGRFMRIIRDGDWTYPFAMNIYRAANDGDKPIASYKRIIYVSRTDELHNELLDPENIHSIKHYLDQLFIPFNIDAELESHQSLTVDVITDKRMIPFNPIYGDNAYLVQRGVAVGTDTISFFAFPADRAEKSRFKAMIPLTTLISAEHSDLFGVLEHVSPYLRTEVGYLEFEDSSPIAYHRLIQNRDENSSLPDYSEMITLTLSRSEYTTIKELKGSIDFLDCFPVYFGVIVHEARANYRYNLLYDRLELVLRGMIVDEDDHVASKEVTTGKMITHVYK